MLIKISEDVVIPVEIIPEDGEDNGQSSVTLADFLAVFGGTISWIADILAYRNLIYGGGTPPPPLPPYGQFKLKENTGIDLSNLASLLQNTNIDLNNNKSQSLEKTPGKMDTDNSVDQNNLIIYLLLAILNALNKNN